MDVNIPPKFENRWRSFDRRLFLSACVITTIILVAICWLVMVLHPLPPHTITMVTGPEGSAFAEYGKLYQQAMARDGIKVKLVSTDGGFDNLARLNDPHSDVQLGFLNSGLTTPRESPQLVSLGTLGYEPLWIFVRGLDTHHGLAVFRGKRVSIGPLKSDTRSLSIDLMNKNGMDVSQIKAFAMTPQEACDALLNHQLDAAVILTSWKSPVIQTLLHTDGIQLANFPRADTYIALYSYMTKVVLLQGIADLAKNIPPTDTNLLATRTSLIVRRNLHPAIQYLLLESAAEIQNPASIFWKSNVFPNDEVTDLPLSKDAQRYYKSGPPLLQRYFPFWLAVLAEQFLVLLLPLIAVVYPLIKGLAALYQWSIQRRIFVIYAELLSLEDKLEGDKGKHTRDGILKNLKQLKQRAAQIRVSSNYIPMLYSLRNQIDSVCDKLE